MQVRRRPFLTLGAAALVSPVSSFAQPARLPGTVRLLVGFPPGATGDRIARAVLPALAAELQTQVIVDNKPGAAGQLAVEFAKNGPADGSLLLQTIGSSMVIYPHTYKGLRYKPFEDFTPIGTAATAPIAFVAAANVPARTLQEAVSLLRTDSNKLGFYGSPASGSVFHFSGVLLQKAMKTPFEHVAFRGSAPLLTDILAGQIPFGFMAPSDILDHHRAGKLRILAVTGSTRASQLPDVPTFPQAGFKDLVNHEWFSYFVAHATPPDVVARLRAALRKVIASQEVRTKLMDAGLEMGEGEAEPLAATMRREYAQWQQIVKEIGFTAD
jgi:tripartite-type tricarboxylate transporter receptor subunit TctC